MLISATARLVTLARTVNKTLMTAKDRRVKTMERVLTKSMDTDVFVVKVLMAVTVRPTLMTANPASAVMEVGCLGWDVQIFCTKGIRSQSNDMLNQCARLTLD